MASNIVKVPLIRTAVSRGYAGFCAPVSGVTNYDVTYGKLPNKTLVAAADNCAPLTRISVVFKAGSRYETPENAGAAHVIRIAAGLSTQNATQFAIIRNIQQVGASLHCTTDRETISYTIEGTRSAVEQVLPYFTEVVSKQVFRPWEVSDNENRLRLELATRPPQLRAVDLLHKAAYRSVGLGNSLYIAKHQLGKISSETLQHYVAQNCTGPRAAVVGLGVDHQQLQQYATSLCLPDGEGCPSESKYKGGEIRSDKGGDWAFIAIAGEGASVQNQKEALAFAVLQKALGTGPQVQYGADNGPLSKATCSVAPNAVSAFNVSYSDSGLFGALIASEYKLAGRAVEAAIKLLRSGSVTDSDVNRGKNQLKTTILSASESARSVVRKIGSSAVLTGQAISPAKYASDIDAVTTADVNAALKKIAKSRLSIASVGNLTCVPFLEDLK